MRIDARIRVHFLDALPETGQSDQLLVVAEGIDDQPPGWPFHATAAQGWAAVLRLAEFQVSAGHRPGCSCCVQRPAPAAALTGIFQARARGEVNYFRSVIAHLPPQQAESLRQVLVSDPFVFGCFVETS